MFLLFLKITQVAVRRIDDSGKERRSGNVFERSLYLCNKVNVRWNLATGIEKWTKKHCTWLFYLLIYLKL